MKRTKELFYRPHPDAREREGISGVTFMDGEDQDFDKRNKEYQSRQREWADQQRDEKLMIKNLNKEIEDNFSRQTLQLNRMGQLLDEDHRMKRQTIQNAARDQNLLLASEKKDKEAREKLQKQKEEQEDIRLLNDRRKQVLLAYSKAASTQNNDLSQTGFSNNGY